MENVTLEALVYGERIFRMELNSDTEKEPNLMGIIDANDLKTKQIRFYAKDQIAGLGEEGKIFILTFLDNRIFFTNETKSRGISLLSRKIFSIDNMGECSVINFEKYERMKLARTESAALISSGLSNDAAATGHEDGSIRIWDITNRSIRVLPGHSQSVRALAADYYGRIYSATCEGGLRVWDIADSVANVITGFEGKISRINPIHDKKILVTTVGTADKHNTERHQANLTVLDLDEMAYLTCPSPLNRKLSGVSVNADGRILVTFDPANGKRQGSLVIISLGPKTSEFKILDSHGKTTEDCLIMGPKFITCGTESDGRHTLRVWSSDLYVKTELNKLIALADTT
jgi:WD40 repeat protein